MGEEEKKPEEKKMEEKKPEEAKKQEEGKEEKKEEPKTEKASGDKKEDKKTAESKEPPPPPPPQEIVLKVYMHCEGCARKVRRCLKGFEGVEDVQTDCKTHTVVVKGEKADPMKVVERVQKKSHRQVELLSPIPKPPAEDAKKTEEKEIAKPEEKKVEPQVITVVLKVYMHCEACSQEIKRRILRMNGVENVEPDLKSSQVTVKGVFDPPKLVDYVYKRTGKHASILKQEPEKKEEEKVKEEKKADAGGDKVEKKSEEAKEKKDGDAGAIPVAAPPPADSPAEGEGETAQVVELKKNEFYYNYPQYYYNYPPNYQINLNPPPRFDSYAYPPQMFSDENPNACSVM